MIDELLDCLRPGDAAPAHLRVGGGGVRVSATRGDVADAVAGFSRGLRGAGLSAGDSVVLLARPGWRTLAFALACVAGGLRVVLLDPRGSDELVGNRLALAEVAAVVTEPGLGSLLGAPSFLRGRLGLPHPTVWPRRLSLRGLARGTGPGLARAGDHARDAVVVFTSGTTAQPRGVVHTLASLGAGMRLVDSLLAGGSAGPVLAGTFFVMLPALAGGRAVMPVARRAPAFARQLAELRPAHTYATPPQWNDVLALTPALTGQAFAGSAPVSGRLLARLRSAGAEKAWGVYAMTEVFPASAVESREKPETVGPDEGDAVGTLFDGVEARVVEGEVRLRGTPMAPRLLGHPPHEEVSTGDLGRLEGRRLWLHGRCKDMILRRAENIYPGLHEPALRMDGVAEAVLVGLPVGDDERVAALVEVESGADRTRLVRRLREVAPQLGVARPDRLWLLEPGQLPRSGRSRKPDRAAAARLAASLPEAEALR